MLHHCDEHVGVKKDDEEKKEDSEEKDPAAEAPKDDTFQTFSVIAVALIAMGEEIGAEMSLRQLNHLVSLSFAFSSI